MPGTGQIIMIVRERVRWKTMVLWSMKGIMRPMRIPRSGRRHAFSKVLCIVRLYRKCTRALTFQNVGAGVLSHFCLEDAHLCEG